MGLYELSDCACKETYSYLGVAPVVVVRENAKVTIRVLDRVSSERCDPTFWGCCVTLAARTAASSL